jgi:hypothetical protein
MNAATLTALSLSALTLQAELLPTHDDNTFTSLAHAQIVVQRLQEEVIARAHSEREAALIKKDFFMLDQPIMGLAELIESYDECFYTLCDLLIILATEEDLNGESAELVEMSRQTCFDAFSGWHPSKVSRQEVSEYLDAIITYYKKLPQFCGAHTNKGGKLPGAIMTAVAGLVLVALFVTSQSKTA